jgi:prolyl-tRNA synthetase
MGALVMTHSDDNGLVLPPNLAPIQVVIVPIFKNEEQLELVSQKANLIANDLKSKGIRVKFDNRTTHKPGWKFAEYELKGIPLRIAIGPKDLEKGTVELARRDTLSKSFENQEGLTGVIENLLKNIQQDLFTKAEAFRDDHITKVDTFEEFKDVLNSKGGFLFAHWDGTSETEEKIKELTKATIRCIPLEQTKETGKCVFSGKESKQRVLFAKAY